MKRYFILLILIILLFGCIKTKNFRTQNEFVSDEIAIITDVIEPERDRNEHGRSFAVGEYKMVLKEEYLWLTELESFEN